MKKILILADGLNTGGITTFLINIVNFYASQNYDVTLGYTNDYSNRISLIDSSVKKRKIGILSNRQLTIRTLYNGCFMDYLKIKNRKKTGLHPIPSFQKMSMLKSKYSKGIDDYYDIAISTSEFFCNNYLSSKVNAGRKIGWIHPHYGSLKTNVKLDRVSLDLLDIIVTVSDESKKSLIDLIPEYSKKVEYIPNLLNDQEIIEKSKHEITDMVHNEDELVVVTVSRLDNSSKRIDRQINACRVLNEEGIKMKWYVIGNGSDRKYLQNLVFEYGLENTMIFLGEKKNPYPYIKTADVFVLSSQYEGRPIVIDEALILGTPVIVSNYCSAKQQVPTNYGHVVPNDDVEFVKEATKRIIDQKVLFELKENLKEYKYDNSAVHSALLKLVK